MGSFFDSKTKKSLSQARSRIDAVTTIYNMELSKLSQSELIYADCITKYRQIIISYVTDPGHQKKGKKEVEAMAKAYADAEILKYLNDRYGINNIPPENIDIAIEGALMRSGRVFEIMDRYKKAIHDAYMSFDSHLRHVSSAPGLTSLNATTRENQFLNEIVTGVFASSGYGDLTNYIGRAIAGGMIVRDGVVLYPRNPFKSTHSSKTKMELLKPVYMYSVDASEFEPSVCFELQHGTKEDGSSIFFPDIKFYDEWTCKKSNVDCEAEEIISIPTAHLKEYQIFYKNGDYKLDYHMPKAEYIKAMKNMLKKKQVGYLNEEYGVNTEFSMADI